jgi:sirohydrochlorin cobaltochelatase
MKANCCDLTNRALLVISFGSSFTSNREKALAPLKAALDEAFPGFDMFSAFTSRMVIDKLKARDGAAFENPIQAVKRLQHSGYREVLVQPLLVIAGMEYDRLVTDLQPLRGCFDRLAIGAPLLSSPADFGEVVNLLRPYCRAEEPQHALVLMGHGSRHAANAVYARQQEAFRAAGLNNVYMATVEGRPVLHDIIPGLKADGVKKVTLMPFMLIAGDHAHNDMAGDGDESWKSILQREGFSVDARITGLGELEGIGEIFRHHAREAWMDGGEK